MKDLGPQAEFCPPDFLTCWGGGEAPTSSLSEEREPSEERAEQLRLLNNAHAFPSWKKLDCAFIHHPLGTAELERDPVDHQGGPGGELNFQPLAPQPRGLNP